jgi:uncharacterized protein YjbI with pentapeptide repeats
MPRLLVFLLAAAALPFPLAGQAVPNAVKQTAWTWTDSNQVAHTRAELDAMLRVNKVWVDSNGSKGKRADFTLAGLANADLHGIDADGADFTSANLTGANLRGANLKNAYFAGGGDAAGADLQGADLSGGDLEGTDLTSAILTWAILIDADLKGADFSNAILNGADLASASRTRGSAPGATPATTQLNLRCLRKGGMSQAILDQAIWDNDALLNGTLVDGGKAGRMQRARSSMERSSRPPALTRWHWAARTLPMQA